METEIVRSVPETDVDTTKKLAPMQTNGYPYSVPKADQRILYNLPDGVKSYVILASEPNTLLCAYLIYDDRIEHIHVLGNEQRDGGKGQSATRLYASECDEIPKCVMVANFPHTKCIDDMIDILQQIREVE